MCNDPWVEPMEWVDAQGSTRLAAQVRTADTAKLITTFASGVAATLTGTALQVLTGGVVLRLAVIAMACSLVLVLAVFATDRLRQPDIEAVLVESQTRGLDAQETVNELRVSQLASLRFNENTLRYMRYLVPLQILVSLLSCGLALAALLGR